MSAVERVPRRVGMQLLVEHIQREGDIEARFLPREAERDPVRPAAADETERTVAVEWIGERSFLDDPRVLYRLLRTGQPDGFTPHQAAVIRAAARRRIARVPGHNREMGPRDGLSRTYVWGPKAGGYVRRMSYRDAERLLASASGHEFRIVGEQPPAPSPAERLFAALPQQHIRLVGAQEFSRIEAAAALEGPLPSIRAGRGSR